MDISRKTRHWFMLTCCLLALALPGCSANRERGDLLEATQRAYLGSLRWGGVESAVGFLNPRMEHDAPPPWFSDLRVTSFRVISGTVAEDGMTAMHAVELRYVHIDYQRELTLIDKQLWSYDEVLKHWYLTSGLPAFEHP
jgi:hypothetical protein